MAGTFMDLTGKDRVIPIDYHGSSDTIDINYVEGRIMSEGNGKLTVSVGLDELDVISHKYDPTRKSLDIFYKFNEEFPARVGCLTFIDVDVPEDITGINIFDSD